MAAIFNFTMTAALPVIFSVIEHISSSRLLITGPTTFATRGAFQVCLETIAIPHARHSTFAWYQCKESYLSDSHCGQFRNITGSLGCLPSPISIIWKFSDCPHKCPKAACIGAMFSMLHDICENSVIHVVSTCISSLVRQYTRTMNLSSFRMISSDMFTVYGNDRVTKLAVISGHAS